MVFAGVRPPAQERKRSQSEGGGRLSQRQLQRTLPHPRVARVFVAEPRQTPVALAQGTLRRGGEGARPATRRRRQVPDTAEVPAAADHLGRRGDVLLLQGEVAGDPQGLLHAQSVPFPAREESSGRGHRTNDHASQQLVQKPSTARPCDRGQREVNVQSFSSRFC